MSDAHLFAASNGNPLPAVRFPLADFYEIAVNAANGETTSEREAGGAAAKNRHR